MNDIGSISNNSVPRVSVVLPSYNRAHCLDNAVQSVLRQTLDNIELIIVDDGSTDGTHEYLATLTDPRVRVLIHEVNKGGAAARNTGIAAARAPIVAFQDSDDQWLVTMLQQQVTKLDSLGADYGASYCGKLVYGRDNYHNFGPRRAGYVPDIDRKTVEGHLIEEVLRHAVISTQTLMVRTPLLRELGGFDESLRVGLDWELTVRLARRTKIAFVEEPLAIVFLMSDSITHRRLSGAHTAGVVIDKNIDLMTARPAVHSQKLYEIGRIYQRAGHWRKAKSVMASAVAKRPTNRRAWLGLIASTIRGAVRSDPVQPG